MKLSVSLPDEDIEFLDDYTRDQGYRSRSAALHKAVSMLRADRLAGAYEDAWQCWDASDDADLWDATAADGLGS